MQGGVTYLASSLLVNKPDSDASLSNSDTILSPAAKEDCQLPEASCDTEGLRVVTIGEYATLAHHRPMDLEPLMSYFCPIMIQ